MIIFGETINVWFALFSFCAGGYVGYQMALAEIDIILEEKKILKEEKNDNSKTC